MVSLQENEPAIGNRILHVSLLVWKIAIKIYLPE